jgi:hypothetical protein
VTWDIRGDGTLSNYIELASLMARTTLHLVSWTHKRSFEESISFRLSITVGRTIYYPRVTLPVLDDSITTKTGCFFMLTSEFI